MWPFEVQTEENKMLGSSKREKEITLKKINQAGFV